MPSKFERLEVDPRLLVPNPWNSNVVGPEMERRLENSMKKRGCYKEIVVRRLPDGTLQILGGQHRTQVAIRLGFATVPVVVLSDIDDRAAKEIGLADNGRYGEDDGLKLAQILRDIGEMDVNEMLPYTSQDLAGIFAVEDIDLDRLGIDDDLDDLGKGPLSLDDVKARPAATHVLMRFKVPIGDQATVEKLVDSVIKQQGLKKEGDSLIGAGMALVTICNAAREVL